MALPLRTCLETGEIIPQQTGRGKPRAFISDAAKQAFANRRMARGKFLIAPLMAWRKTRGDRFGTVCSMLDDMIAQDKAAGRASMDAYALTLTVPTHRAVRKLKREWSKGHCGECSKLLPTAVASPVARVFCDDTCKNAFNNRRAVRGKMVLPFAMGWRKLRGSGDNGKALFARLTDMLDAWNEEDRRAGRMPADAYDNTLGEYGLAGASSYKERRAPRLACGKRHQGCLKTSPGVVGGSEVDAGRVARAKGWLVEFADGYHVRKATCPNCRDDNALAGKAN